MLKPLTPLRVTAELDLDEPATRDNTPSTAPDFDHPAKRSRVTRADLEQITVEAARLVSVAEDEADLRVQAAERRERNALDDLAEVSGKLQGAVRELEEVRCIVARMAAAAGVTLQHLVYPRPTL